MNLAANTMGGEHTCCRHTMPAHGSSHHGWRIITDNAGSRQLTPRVEYNSHTMPAHGSSHHGWRIITDNPGSRHSHTTWCELPCAGIVCDYSPPMVRAAMPAHGSSHHGWRIITDNAGIAHGSSHHGWRIIQHTLTAHGILTPRGVRMPSPAMPAHGILTPRVENNSQTMPAHGSSHHGWRIIHRQCRHSL